MSLAAREARFRRRRAAATLTVVGLLALLVAALSGAHHKASAVARARAGSPRTGSAAPGGGRSGAKPRTQAAPDPRRAVAAVLAYTPFVKEGAANGRDIALTFDDGPGPYTPGVLDMLEHLHVRATFFAIGMMERYFSASTVREIQDGDVVGDHTQTHPKMALLSAHDQREQLFEQLVRIEVLGGTRPTLFRPPYGSFNAVTMHELHALHMLMVLWSVDTGDYLQPGVEQIVTRALAGAHPGAILLMHDGGGDRSQTIAALPIIVDKLRARGFDLVTVPQLLADDPPPPGQPLPPTLSGD
jgi:peptidoglycan-N-acetylglucosamine deacetylase